MKRHSNFVSGVAFLFCACSGGVAWAHLIGNTTWSVDSPNGRYRLVMLAGEEESPAEVELAERYTQSGVYELADEPNRLLWEAPAYYKSAYEVRLSDDGQHLFIGHLDSLTSFHNTDPPFRTYEASFLFLHRDQPSLHWKEQDLIRGLLVKSVLSRFLLQREFYQWEIAAYDPAIPNRVTLTNVGEEHVLDFTTGRRVRARSVWDASVAAFLVGAPLAFFVTHRSSSRSSIRRSRFQVSLGELTLLITTVAGLLALGRCGWGLSAAVSGVGLVGATVAWLIGRCRAAAWAGAWLTVYGAVLGLTLFAVGIEPIMWWRFDKLGQPFAEWMLGCFYGLPGVGGLVGAVVGGWRLRQRRGLGGEPAT